LVEAARIPWRPLGCLLVEQGLLSEAELERALEAQASTGRRLGETMVELGFVSHPALCRALAAQYGIELKGETGFGTGLRAEIERRHDLEREDEIEPGLKIADTPSVFADVSDPEAPDAHPSDGDDLHLAQLEEQWAKLAAAEELLARAEGELTALGRAVTHRRKQAWRLVARIRRRDCRIVELSATDLAEPSQRDAGSSLGHLVYAQLGGRYELVERDGAPPEPDAILELSETGESVLIGWIGKSPLPNDARPCAFAHPVGASPPRSET
jgi:hypothetical protein